MITRKGFVRNFGVVPAYHDNIGGMIKTATVNGVEHTWAIARPGGVYTPNGCPHYLNVADANRGLMNHVVRSKQPALYLPAQQVAMDPSDTQTWRRPYRFT